MEASGKKLAAMSYMMVTRKVAYKVTMVHDSHLITILSYRSNKKEYYYCISFNLYYLCSRNWFITID